MAHRYWRIYVTKSTSGSNMLLSFYEMEMRANVGGADQCNGGTANASHADASAGNLFDNNNSNYWVNGSPSVDCWIKYDFGAGNAVEVGQLVFLPRYSNQCPEDFKLEWSDDNIAWTVAYSWTAVTDWVGSTWKYITVPVPPVENSVLDGALFGDTASFELIRPPGMVDDFIGFGDYPEARAIYQREIADTATFGDSAEISMGGSGEEGVIENLMVGDYTEVEILTQYKHWRLYIYNDVSANFTVHLRFVEMFVTRKDAMNNSGNIAFNETVVVTASENLTGLNAATNVLYHVGGAHSSYPWIMGSSTGWIAFEFINPQNVQAMHIDYSVSTTRLQNFDIQASHDGSDWLTLRCYRNIADSGSDNDHPTIFYTQEDGSKFWRILIENQNGSQLAAIKEMRCFEGTPGSYPNMAVAGIASASSYLLDTSTPNYGFFTVDPNNPILAYRSWISDPFPRPHWLQYEFTDKTIISDITLLCDDNSSVFPDPIFPYDVYDGAHRAPKDFLIQSSDDGVNWKTRWGFTNERNWHLSVKRKFRVGFEKYTYYKLVFSGARSGSDQIEIKQINIAGDGLESSEYGIPSPIITTSSNFLRTPTQILNINDTVNLGTQTPLEEKPNHWLMFEYLQPVFLTTIIVEIYSDRLSNAPKDMTVLKSKNGIDWVLGGIWLDTTGNLGGLLFNDTFNDVFFSDSITTTDETHSFKVFEKVLSEIALYLDQAGGGFSYDAEAIDGYTLGAILLKHLSVVVPDRLTITSATSFFNGFEKLIQDGMRFSDVAIFAKAIITGVFDGITLNDINNSWLAFVVNELQKFDASIQTNGIFLCNRSEGFRLKDKINSIARLQKFLEEQSVFSDTTGIQSEKLIAFVVHEMQKFEADIQTNWKFFCNNSEKLTLNDKVNLVARLQKFLEEQSVFSDTTGIQSEKLIAFVVQEIQKFEAAIQANTVISKINNEMFGFSDVAALKLFLMMEISEQADFADILSIQSESIVSFVINELQKIGDSTQTNTIFPLLSNEFFNIKDVSSLVTLLMKSIEEQAVFTDIAGTQLGNLILFVVNELQKLGDSTQSQAVFNIIRNEVLHLSDAVTGFNLLLRTIAEQTLFTVTSDTSVTKVLKILDRFRCKDTLSGNLIAFGSIEEQFAIRDAIRWAWNVLADEMLNISDVVEAFRGFSLKIAESIYLAGHVSSMLQAQMVVSLAFALHDTMTYGKIFIDEALDGLMLSEDLAKSWLLAASAMDGMFFTDALSKTVRLGAIVEDQATFEGSAEAGQIFQQLIEDGIKIFISFSEGDGEGRYYGFVVNTETHAVTEYDNFPFNSLTTWNGVVFGANKTGIYRLSDAVDDNGQTILSSIQTGLMDFESPNLKQVTEAYLGIRGTGKMILKTVYNGNQTNMYEINVDNPGMAGSRVKMGRGAKSRYWQFEIQNNDGKLFYLDEIVFYPIILSRKER